MRIIVPPADPVISLEIIKRDLRIDHDDDNMSLEDMITEATQWVEQRAQMALLTQTRELDFSTFPIRSFDLLQSRPIQSVTSITYYDTLYTLQTMLTGFYLNGTKIVSTSTWPTGSDVTIRFVAGYASVDLVPAPLKAAVRVKVQELFDQVDMTATIDGLLSNYLYLVA